jgi:hypothetical protein
MNKILALDPRAIDSMNDWVKVYPFVGHEKGLFLANFPKLWAKKFLERDFDPNHWMFNDIEKVKEFLIFLEKSNAFVSLQSPYNFCDEWSKNYSKIEDHKRQNCIAFKSRKDSGDLETLDDLDPRHLFIDSTIEKKFTPKQLIQSLKIFLQNSSKIAIVDRHNYLSTLDQKPSLFVEFVKEILEVTISSKCHEIIIYAKHDPDRYPYMVSNDSLKQHMTKVFDNCITPTYGIKYICCSEYKNNNDLHARKIITNHAVFLLTDSIAGRTFSQSITRVHDASFRESNLKFWIDQEHGLDVKASAVFVNKSRGQSKKTP